MIWKEPPSAKRSPVTLRSSRGCCVAIDRKNTANGARLPWQAGSFFCQQKRPAMNNNGQRVIWEPTPKQAEFLSCPAREVLFGGSAGGGKTIGLLAGALSQV